MNALGNAFEQMAMKGRLVLLVVAVITANTPMQPLGQPVGYLQPAAASPQASPIPINSKDITAVCIALKEGLKPFLKIYDAGGSMTSGPDPELLLTKLVTAIQKSLGLTYKAALVQAVSYGIKEALMRTEVQGTTAPDGIHYRHPEEQADPRYLFIAVRVTVDYVYQDQFLGCLKAIGLSVPKSGPVRGAIVQLNTSELQRHFWMTPYNGTTVALGGLDGAQWEQPTDKDGVALFRLRVFDETPPSGHGHVVTESVSYHIAADVHDPLSPVNALFRLLDLHGSGTKADGAVVVQWHRTPHWRGTITIVRHLSLDRVDDPNCVEWRYVLPDLHKECTRWLVASSRTNAKQQWTFDVDSAVEAVPHDLPVHVNIRYQSEDRFHAYGPGVVGCDDGHSQIVNYSGNGAGSAFVNVDKNGKYVVSVLARATVPKLSIEYDCQHSTARTESEQVSLKEQVYTGHQEQPHLITGTLSQADPDRSGWQIDASWSLTSDQ